MGLDFKNFSEKDNRTFGLGRINRCLTQWFMCVLTGSVLITIFFFWYPASADIYKYVDDNEQRHYTNNPSSIPEKYRDQIKIEIKDSSQTLSSQCFIDNQDGTITDTRTGLIWLQDVGWQGPSNLGSNDEGVLDYRLENGKLMPILSRSQIVRGKLYVWENGEKRLVNNNWRLPTLEELRGLVYADGHMPAGGEGIELPPGHPFKNVSPYYYWTSTKIGNGFKVLYLKTGITHGGNKWNDCNRIWPVKNGP